MYVFNVFCKSEKKHVFYIFHLQINVINIHGTHQTVVPSTHSHISLHQTVDCSY